eukprot:627455-Prorocentrum_minimum.AAC.1
MPGVRSMRPEGDSRGGGDYIGGVTIWYHSPGMEEVKELSVTPGKMPGVRSVGHVPLASYCRVSAVQMWSPYCAQPIRPIRTQ